WVLVLVGTSAALAAVCELVFLRDIFETRMNTVFKLYFQAWLLLGIAGGPALAWLLSAARRALAAALPPAVTTLPRGLTVERTAPGGPTEPVPGATLAFVGPAQAGATRPTPTHAPSLRRRASWPQARRRGFIRRPSWFGRSSSQSPLSQSSASPASSAPSAVPLSAPASRSSRSFAAFAFSVTPSPRPPRTSATSAFSAIPLSAPANGPTGLRRVAAGGILIWMAALVVLVAAALVFPVLAASNQTAGFSLPHSLDGTAYMATDSATVPADCANFVGAGSNAHDDEAIAWLNTHITGSPVIVEAPGCEWSHYSRISAFTGLPTLIGWPGGHEGEWRAGWVQRTGEYGIFDRRTAAVNQIYTDPDNAAVLALLKQYDVRLIYVGAAERNLYPHADLNRFQSFLHMIYNRDGVTIYAVPA
ncbi:MAG TPA: DUF2298 domain-containing protein, partial [Ktedonobacterales bacterium]